MRIRHKSTTRQPWTTYHDTKKEEYKISPIEIDQFQLKESPHLQPFIDPKDSITQLHLTYDDNILSKTAARIIFE